MVDQAIGPGLLPCSYCSMNQAFSEKASAGRLAQAFGFELLLGVVVDSAIVGKLVAIVRHNEKLTLKLGKHFL